MNLSEEYKNRLKELGGITSFKKEDILDVKLYHGTISERWKKGFMNYLFVTSDFNFAKQQAMDWISNENKYTPIVVEINVKDIINYTWEVDDDDGRYPYKTWIESFENIGCFVVVGHLDIEKFPIIWEFK